MMKLWSLKMMIWYADADGTERNNRGENFENKGEDNADEEMYAVVDKDKTKTTQNTDADDIVICENDDLYETEPAN